jgi:hypothetical protein
MSDPDETFRAKVDAIFCEIAGEDLAASLRATTPSRVMDVIAQAISSYYDPEVAADIGFHTADWQADAAFIVALHLFPDRFTPEEIDEGIRALLVHVPAHVIAAAKLAGYSTDDIFEDGAPAA